VKKAVKMEQIPSPPAEKLLLLVDDMADDKEHLPDIYFIVDNDNTRMIMQATSDNCMTLNGQKPHGWLLCITTLMSWGAPPPEDWDGQDSTVRLLQNFFKIPMNSSGRVWEIISQVHHCHCIGTQYTGARNSEGELDQKVIIKKIH
jgi:hypothetical protein